MTLNGLEELYGEKKRVLGTIEQTVKPLSLKQVSFRPKPDAWSVGEIVEHLSIVEPGMIRLVRSLVEKAAPRSAGAPFSVTLDDGIVTGATGKLVTRPEAVPTGNVIPAKSLQILQTIQSELVDLGPKLAGVDVSSVKFTHRALGDLTLGQWCAFFGAHEARHLGQMRSVIASSGFPR
jgi:uncharacterized damage-inducible protein DinB